MKRAFLLSLLLLVPTVRASEAEMQKVLDQWNQLMSEYQAALEIAGTPERQAGVIPPRTDDVAKKLWKAVSAKTGTRKVTNRDKSVKQVSVYEYEHPWAAPAVAWFITHPDDFAKVLADKPRQRAYFAEALLNSVERVHFSSPDIEPVCATLIGSPNLRSYKILEKIFTGNADPTAKASSALAMSIMLGDPLVSSAVGNKDEVRRKRIHYLKQAARFAPADKLFGAVTYEAAITEATYILRFLSEGTVPPQLYLKDAKGQSVTLPQPGKPHLLYFWAPTDPDAFAAVRHMESVKDSYPHLVICPITAAAQDPQQWRETLEQNSISTCYTDDGKGTAAADFRVPQVPYVVLLDDRCRILYIGAPGLELQTAIMKLGKAKPAPATPDTKPATPAETPEKPANPDDAPPALRDMPDFD